MRVRFQITDLSKQKKLDYIFMMMVFIGYLVFNGILLARHEMWRDEANVWLMARELSPIALLKEIKYQGHPCLWYLLLMPFAKAGLPFKTISFVSYSIMAVTAGLFLYKAPFYKPIKAVMLFSPVFTYYYAVIARNYCLTALLLILLAVYYPKRNNKCVLYGLLLGLLVQSDIIALAEAGVISCFWLGENLWQCYKEKTIMPFRNILKGIWIPLCSLLLLIMQFYHVSDSPVFKVDSLGKMEFFREVRNYSYRILERLSGRGQIFCLFFFLICIGLMVLVSVRLRSLQAMTVMVSAFLFQAIFSVLVYQLHIWHFLSLCFVLIWTLWIMYEQKTEKQTGEQITGAALCGLQILTLILSICMFVRWNAEEESSSLGNALYGSYSDGGKTADFIKENIQPDELIVSVNVPRASTVLAYLPEYNFYYAGNGQKESYADWSEGQSTGTDFEKLTVWVKNNFPDKQEFYLLDCAGSCLGDLGEKVDNWPVLYKTKEETARGEEYTVYLIKL